MKNNLLELVKYLRRSLELTEKLSVSLQDELDLYVRILISKEDASAKILRQRLRGGRTGCKSCDDSFDDYTNTG